MTDDAKRAEWLEERRKGIGGSDAAAACGQCPFKDRLTLWSEKVGLLDPADLSDNEAVQSGIELERAIGEWYAKKYGRDVVLAEPYTILKHPTIPFMRATLDATQIVDGVKSVVQIKNTGAPAEAWEDEIPTNYEIQLQHEMLVAGVECGTLVALHRGQKLRAYDRVLMPELASQIIELEREFWEMVVSETAPPAGPHSGGTVKALFPRNEIEDVVALAADADDLDAELQLLKKQQDQLADRREAIESQLKMWIGKHAGGLTPQGVRFSWKGSEVHYKPQEARTAYVRRFTRSAK